MTYLIKLKMSGEKVMVDKYAGNTKVFDNSPDNALQGMTGLASHLE